VGDLLTYTIPLHKVKLLRVVPIDALRSPSWNILCRTGVSQRRHGEEAALELRNVAADGGKK
jgi:hypothetical protein